MLRDISIRSVDSTVCGDGLNRGFEVSLADKCVVLSADDRVAPWVQMAL